MRRRGYFVTLPRRGMKILLFSIQTNIYPLHSIGICKNGQNAQTSVSYDMIHFF